MTTTELIEQYLKAHLKGAKFLINGHTRNHLWVSKPGYYTRLISCRQGFVEVVKDGDPCWGEAQHLDLASPNFYEELLGLVNFKEKP
jgi:hypothetical protein